MVVLLRYALFCFLLQILNRKIIIYSHFSTLEIALPKQLPWRFFRMEFRYCDSPAEFRFSWKPRSWRSLAWRCSLSKTWTRIWRTNLKAAPRLWITIKISYRLWKWKFAQMLEASSDQVKFDKKFFFNNLSGSQFIINCLASLRVITE